MTDLTLAQRSALTRLIRKQTDYKTEGFVTAPLGVQRRTMSTLETKGYVEREVPYRYVPTYQPTEAGRKAVA